MLAAPDVGGEQRLGYFQNREFPENLGRSWVRGSIGKAQRQLDRRHPTCSGTSFIGRGKSRLRRVGLGSQIRRWFPAGITFWNSAQSVGGSLPVENVVRIAMAAIAKPVVIAATIVATMPVTTSPVTVRNRIIVSVVRAWAVVGSVVSGHGKRYPDVQRHECLALGVATLPTPTNTATTSSSFFIGAMENSFRNAYLISSEKLARNIAHS